MRRPGGDEGASAVEYGLIAVAIAAAVVAVVVAFGFATETLFADSCATIDAQISAGANCQ